MALEVGGSNPLFHPRKNILKNLEIFFGVPKFSLSLQPLSEEKGEREKLIDILKEEVQFK